MQGDFSNLRFDPHEHERGVRDPALGVLRNISGVLHQQGRVALDTDHTEGELLDIGWQGQAGRDIIGAGVAAVPAAQPDGYEVVAARAVGGEVRVDLRPGRVWGDGILAHLAGSAAAPTTPVERRATYLGSPISSPQPDASTIGENVRDAVILELSEEALNGFQYPERLIEPALGGPDTTERVIVNQRIRLLRLAEGEDCSNIGARLRDDLSAKGRLSAILAPTVAIGGDCPVVGGGGYTGMEHALYRIEIAETGAGPQRFKWSSANGSLAGRGRFDATFIPNRVVIDAGRAAIVHSNETSFYLEALRYDALTGAWEVVCGTQATLNAENDLDLVTPPLFGALPATTDPVFFRLWNGIEEIAAFTNAASPVELRDGIRLVFDAPAAGNYRSGDYWTFALRAGEIANDALLLDEAPPQGVVYHRVPLAEIHWTGRLNTEVSGTIQDCRRRFRPLTNQNICCTFLVGDGVRSFGDFNSLEQAAAHLPLAGGELCLLPGIHRANLRLDGRRNIKIHGCARRSLVLPRDTQRLDPLLHFIDCDGIVVEELDLVTYEGIAVLIDGRREGSCRDVRIAHTRMVARIHCIRANDAAGLHIAENRLHLLDTRQGLTTVSLAADDSLVERNIVVLLPFVDPTPNDPEVPDDDPARDPADPCARPEIIYRFQTFVLAYVFRVWAFVLAQLVPLQPYRAIGGIHLRAGSERVRLLENVVIGGSGNGITLGGDLDPPTPSTEPPPPTINIATGLRPTTVGLSASTNTLRGRVRRASDDEEEDATVAVTVDAGGQFNALVADAAGTPQAGVDVYLEGADNANATDRSDAEGQATVKTAPGRKLLSVAPRWRITRVAETRDQGVLVQAITVAERGATLSKAAAFLHEITIEANNVSMMGLSGIGFAPRRGASLGRAAATPNLSDAKANLLGFVDGFITNFALSPLLRASHPVRDLVVLNNRLHHNLRNPFTEALLADAQLIGRGGISLGVVDSAAIRGNHIDDNGLTAIDPACGIFVGWGNDVEICDNTLAGNGPITPDYEERRRAGLRGGIYIRFAGALTTRLSASTGRRPALRAHDNRVDQSAGRAFTAFAFGPVSVANNHFSSEFTGRFGFVDSAVGGVLLGNLGGIHRWVARLAGRKIDSANRLGTFAARAEAAMPGGETLVSDNYVRLDAVNRSLMCQALLSFDDLGFDGNTSAVYRGDPFFCNTLIVADTLRATGTRLREDARLTLSMFTLALRANLTSHNQADHCIFARPAAGGTHQPRTVEVPNQIFDSTLCRNADGQTVAVGVFAAPALSAQSAQLGGTISPDAFTATEVNGLSQRYAAQSMQQVQTTQVAVTRSYQAETQRLSAKLGSNHPKTQAMAAQAESAAATRSLIATSAEAGASVGSVTVPDAGAAVSGRVVNVRGQGQAGLTVELVNANRGPVLSLGRSDANGAFGAGFDSDDTAKLARAGKLLPRVLDAAGRELLLGDDAVAIVSGADVQIVLTLPAKPVPRSTIETGTVIFGSTGGVPSAPTPAAPTPTPTPPSPTPASPTPPAPTPPAPTPPAPPPARVRTPLERLDIDESLRKRLREGGIADVEAVLELTSARLTAIVGDRSTAAKLREMAKALLANNPPPPAPAPAPAPAPNPGGGGGIRRGTVVGGTTGRGDVAAQPPQPPAAKRPAKKAGPRKTPRSG